MDTPARQQDLFAATRVTRQGEGSVHVPGLLYYPEFITAERHDALLAEIDREPWLSDLSRRVQHYGYKYDYKARTIDQTMRIGDLPAWAAGIADMFRHLWDESPDQVIVNEYQPGQGIAPHIDCVPCFTGTIVSLSLGSACVMGLMHKATRAKQELLLEPRSLLVMSGEARTSWTHGIAKRKTDRYQGRTIPRRRRVSLTFRKVILGE